MKKVMIILIMLISVKVSAPPPPKSLPVLRGDIIRPYERVFLAASMIESSGDLFAYNDNEKAYGIVQIRLIRLRDYNTSTGSNYTPEDLYKIEVSRRIFMYYASQIDYRDPERVAREWNGWRNGMKKKSTEEYWEKVKVSLLKNSI